jgi:hypothetical protein
MKIVYRIFTKPIEVLYKIINLKIYKFQLFLINSLCNFLYDRLPPTTNRASGFYWPAFHLVIVFDLGYSVFAVHFNPPAKCGPG